MSVLSEGQAVQWCGPGDFSARGHIIAIAGRDTVHVKWATGPNTGDITLTDVYDLDPFTASKNPYDEDKLHLTAVRKAFDKGGEAEVINFLASNEYLQTWASIAEDVYYFVENKLVKDASMSLVEEQLTSEEMGRVVRTAVFTLLRDLSTDDGE